MSIIDEFFGYNIIKGFYCCFGFLFTHIFNKSKSFVFLAFIVLRNANVPYFANSAKYLRYILMIHCFRKILHVYHACIYLLPIYLFNPEWYSSLYFDSIFRHFKHLRSLQCFLYSFKLIAFFEVFALRSE